MSKQDKATTDKFAKTLRELVKRPENKVCADCKKNDPRWASWNLGVFLCIRCSGIHRGMGTHISKVKSVDLDVWTPEQMGSIQKWGNHLANLYWEAHLKPGHVPPEHKMESFIRSKYESRRWALEGPPPSDPSILDTGTFVSSTSASKFTSGQGSVSVSASPSPAPQQAKKQEQQTKTPAQAQAPGQGFARHQLLSSNYTLQSQSPSLNQNQIQPQIQGQAQGQDQGKTQNKGADDIFSLDFHAPAVTTTPPTQSASKGIKKDPKQDILSLFSSPTSVNVSTSAWQGASDFPQQHQYQQPGVGAGVAQAQVQAPITSMLGTSGTGTWGVSSGWQGAAASVASGPGTAAAAGFGTGGVPVLPAQPNIWGSPANSTPSMGLGFGVGLGASNGLVDTTSIWGGPPAPGGSGAFGTGTGTGLGVGAAQGGFGTQTNLKKDDAFGDIWGGFK